MDIYISNLTDICNKSDLLGKLTPEQCARYQSFARQLRADQFLCAHSIANDLEKQFQYISISHKDNWVIVVGANIPVGVDIENAAKKRNFAPMGAFLGVGGISTDDEFYRAFTAAEARYKMQPAIPTVTRFYKLGDYMICLATAGDDLPRFIGAIPEQIQ
ncbi:MAG: hypothetical protein J5608_03540 [Alphaproteobacteria bacterium]|nr:hypothetical protein [Alphaproteobacteria bacterium]